MTCIDLNFRLLFSLSKSKGEAYVCRCYNLYSSNGSPAMETFSNMCYQIPGRLQSTNIQMCRTLSGNGFCTVNIPRKSAGYRNMSACYGFPAVSHGYQEHGFKKQSFTRKRKTRLAYLRRLCSNPLIDKAKTLYANEQLALDLDSTVYALDSTTIDLCMSLFPWARFRKTKSAIKLHTLMNLRGSIPEFIHITDGTVHDVNILDLLVPTPGAFYIMDRAYLDFQRLYSLHQERAFFISRAKNNFKFKRRYSHEVKKNLWCSMRPDNYSNNFLSSKDVCRTFAKN